MNSRFTRNATALVLATMLTVSVLASLDVLAVSETASAQMQLAQATVIQLA